MSTTSEIRAELARQGMSIKDLAGAMHCNYETLRRRLRGDAQLTDVDVTHIGRVLGVPGWELMRRAEQRLEEAA